MISNVKRMFSFLLALAILLGSMTSLVEAATVGKEFSGKQLVKEGLAYEEGNFFIIPYNEKLEDNIKDQFLSEDESAILYEASSSESSLVFPDIGDFILKESVFLSENKEVVLPENIVRVGDIPEAERILYHNEALERGAGNFELVIDSSGEEAVSDTEVSSLISEQATSRFEEIKDTLLVSNEVVPEAVGASNKPAFNEDGHPLRKIRIKAKFIENYAKKPENKISQEKIDGITLSLLENKNGRSISLNTVYKEHNLIASESINYDTMEVVFEEYLDPNKVYAVVINEGNGYYRSYPYPKNSWEYDTGYAVTFTPDMILFKGSDVDNNEILDEYSIEMRDSDDRDDVTRYEIEMSVQNTKGENAYGVNYGLYSADGNLIARSKTINPIKHEGFETIIFIADFLDSDDEYLPCYIEEFPVSKNIYKADTKRYMVSKANAEDKSAQISNSLGENTIFYKHIDLDTVVRELVDGEKEVPPAISGYYIGRVVDEKTGYPVSNVEFGLYDKNNKLIEREKSSLFGYIVFLSPIIEEDGFYIELTGDSESKFDSKRIDINLNTVIKRAFGSSIADSIYKLDFDKNKGPLPNIEINSKDKNFVPKTRHLIHFKALGGDSSINRPVSDVLFGLFDSDDNLITSTKSNYNGLVFFDVELPVGQSDYTIKALSDSENYSKGDKVFTLDFGEDLNSKDYDYGGNWKGLFYGKKAIFVDKGNVYMYNNSEDTAQEKRDGLLTLLLSGDDYSKIENLEFVLFDEDGVELQRKPYNGIDVIRFFIKNAKEESQYYSVLAYGNGLSDEGEYVFNGSLYNYDGEKFYTTETCYTNFPTDDASAKKYKINIQLYDKETGRMLSDSANEYFNIYHEDGTPLGDDEEIKDGKYFAYQSSSKPEYEYFDEKIWFNTDDAVASDDGEYMEINLDIRLEPRKGSVVFANLIFSPVYILESIETELYQSGIENNFIYIFEGIDENTEGVWLSGLTRGTSGLIISGFYPEGRYSLKLMYPAPFKSVSYDNIYLKTNRSFPIITKKDKKSPELFKSAIIDSPMYDELGSVNLRDLFGKYNKIFGNPLSSVSDVSIFGSAQMSIGSSMDFYVFPNLVDIQLKKIGLGSDDKDLGGVKSTFELYRLDFDGSIEKETKKIIETDNNGDALIEDLLVSSNYVLKEISTDPNYNLNEKKVYFYISQYGEVYLYKENIDPPKYAPRDIRHSAFRKLKYDNTIWDVRRVYYSDLKNSELYYPYSPESMLVGDNTESLPIGLANNPVDKITFVNRLKQGTILLKKYGDNKELLAGAKFELYKDDQLIDTGITNKDGILEFNGLAMGDYVVREVESPNGYVLSGEDIVVTLADEEVVEVEVDNEKAELPVTGSVEVFALMAAGLVLLFILKKRD